MLIRNLTKSVSPEICLLGYWLHFFLADLFFGINFNLKRTKPINFHWLRKFWSDCDLTKKLLKLTTGNIVFTFLLVSIKTKQGLVWCYMNLNWTLKLYTTIYCRVDETTDETNKRLILASHLKSVCIALSVKTTTFIESNLSKCLFLFPNIKESSPSSFRGEIILFRYLSKISSAHVAWYITFDKEKNETNSSLGMLTNSEIKLISVDFEVTGKVQGVSFRAYTQEMAKKNRLVGWVKNTLSGSVVGTVQGPTEKVNTLKKWLRNTGSPDSEISGCKFSNEREIPALEFCYFFIRH